jgi:hypothetical protein
MHGIIRLVRFIPKIKVGVVEWVVINLHLILQISGKKIDVTGCQ